LDNYLPYDKKNAFSIEAYAKKLLNKSLIDVLGDKVINFHSGKGKLGQIIEELFFKYKPNSDSQADFFEAGLELKTTPIKKIAKGFVSKERLVFNIIDYNEEYKYSFRDSSFWRKNSLLLLMFYLYEEEKLDIEYIFKIIRLWRFPAEDLKIIKDDWLKIIQKIKNGLAHEISEGDTLYLGACTKGVNKNSMRSQPFSSLPAKQRAFSLKSKYLNFIIQESLLKKESLPDDSEYENILREIEIQLAAEPPTRYYRPISLFDVEPIVKDLSEYKEEETFEELVQRKFLPFLGKTELQLAKEFHLSFDSKAKNKFEIIARAILGVKKKKIKEFEKADVIMKTIRIESNNSIKESMSFKQIQFKEIINEEWEDSVWHDELNRRFFFVIFQANKNGEYYLKKVKFWSIPKKDIDILGEVWEDTKQKIKQGDFENFIKASNDKIGHIRPKAINADDLMEAPNGTMQKKKSFWLNSTYIKEIVTK
jgi:DNA mismatch repair protein MutH